VLQVTDLCCNSHRPGQGGLDACRSGMGGPVLQQPVPPRPGGSSSSDARCAKCTLRSVYAKCAHTRSVHLPESVVPPRSTSQATIPPGHLQSLPGPRTPTLKTAAGPAVGPGTVGPAVWLPVAASINPPTLNPFPPGCLSRPLRSRTSRLNSQAHSPRISGLEGTLERRRLEARGACV
jgi:hypothetical protein